MNVVFLTLLKQFMSKVELSHLLHGYVQTCMCMYKIHNNKTNKIPLNFMKKNECYFVCI